MPWNPVAGKRGKSRAFDHWHEADAYWREQEARMRAAYAERGVQLPCRSAPSLAEFITTNRLGKPDAAKWTVQKYRVQARQIAKRWPTEGVDELTEQMILDYLADIHDDGLSPDTALARLTTLRHGMRLAIKLGYRRDDPTAGIPGPALREHEGRPLDEPELMLMLACLPAWLWPAALLSHDAGLRIGEVAGLRLFRLNLLRRVVTIADVIDADGELRTWPKGKHIADVPLSARVVAALSEHLRCFPPAGAEAPVFSVPADVLGRQKGRRRGGHLMQSRIRGEWDRALLLANLPGAKPTWHDLRHSCATILAQNHADIEVIMAIMRHRRPDVTLRYIRRANLARQAAAIQGAFGGVSGASSSQLSTATRPL
ncbi:MAG: site-specific integrase [Pseudonocardiales bacterium]|nr:site-specific integrase [Pseudonocardiales bacterium]